MLISKITLKMLIVHPVSRYSHRNFLVSFTLQQWTWKISIHLETSVDIGLFAAISKVSRSRHSKPRPEIGVHDQHFYPIFAISRLIKSICHSIFVRIICDFQFTLLLVRYKNKANWKSDSTNRSFFRIRIPDRKTAKGMKRKRGTVPSWLIFKLIAFDPENSRRAHSYSKSPSLSSSR